MNTGTGKEPLLRKRSKLNYFIEDGEYSKLPIFQTTLWDQLKKPRAVALAMCLVFVVEKFFFLLALKQANDCEIPTAVLLTFIVSSVTCLANIRIRESTLITGLHSQTLGFAIVGILDACYMFMLFAGAANLTAFSISIQLQTPIVLMLVCRLIFTGQSYRGMHYAGAVVMLAVIIVDIQQTEAHGHGGSALLVFFSFLPHTISQMLKIAMLRTGAFCCFSFNKWTLFFTFVFSLALLVIISLLDSEESGKWGEVSGCVACLLGGENCTLEPVYLLLFVLSTLGYQSFVYFAARKDDHSRLASSLNVALCCLGFSLASIVTHDASPDVYEWGCAAGALVGGVLYFFYQEYPPKLCYSK